MERAWNLMKKKIKKWHLHKQKTFLFNDDIDADRILVPKKEPNGINYSIKYLVGYNDDDVIRSPCIKLPQMNG